jgi:hypothetical protein
MKKGQDHFGRFSDWSDRWNALAGWHCGVIGGVTALFAFALMIEAMISFAASSGWISMAQCDVSLRELGYSNWLHTLVRESFPDKSLRRSVSERLRVIRGNSHFADTVLTPLVTNLAKTPSKPL